MSEFPVRWTEPHFKTPKGDRLRADKKAAGKAASDLTKLYAAVYKRDDYRCVACGRIVKPGSMEELERAHPHHIIFRSQAKKAEKHTMENVCTVCPFCHADIHDGHLKIAGNAQTRRLKIRRIAA